ncbi:hypothetical protein L596_021736 [Steinernema carpocapsae]|uniref:Uncharacterized protein n=1 Tax=Steinernema carpocapsae TaxID=34508 RepID=A0A4U5MJM2_STECR|nr:hypothetical protein L596_021736 [Steinernema carpocapsae]
MTFLAVISNEGDLKEPSNAARKCVTIKRDLFSIKTLTNAMKFFKIERPRFWPKACKRSSAFVLAPIIIITVLIVPSLVLYGIRSFSIWHGPAPYGRLQHLKA